MCQKENENNQQKPLKEGMEKRGGYNPPPLKPKPNNPPSPQTAKKQKTD
jgi:hypothetical protein